MKKKLIALFGALSLVAFGFHTVLSIRYFVGAISYTPVINILGIIFVVFVTVHAILAVSDMIRLARKTKNDKFYGKYIAEHGFQNISGIGIYIAAILHTIAIEANRAVGSNLTGIIWFVADIVLYIFVCMHFIYSVPHIFISLGIVTNPIVYKIIRLLMIIISIILFVLLVNAHWLFYQM